LVVLLMMLPMLPAMGRWESAQDSKSTSGLEELSLDQVFNEAFDVCVRRALLENSDAPGVTVAEASEYLNAIYPIVREKNGGAVPTWMAELFNAHTTKECQHAFHGYVSDVEKSPPIAKRNPTRHAKAATSGPRRSHWTEELPPWFAPR